MRYCGKPTYYLERRKNEGFGNGSPDITARHHSNSLWQMDFKELEQGRYLFTIIDDHSRFILACRVLRHATTAAVLDTLSRAVKMFGQPRQILTDHGTQFWSSRGGQSTFGYCKNWTEFENKLQKYIEWYNTTRLHWSINLTTPLQTYTAGSIKPEDFTPPRPVNELT